MGAGEEPESRGCGAVEAVASQGLGRPMEKEVLLLFLCQEHQNLLNAQRLGILVLPDIFFFFIELGNNLVTWQLLCFSIFFFLFF